MHLRPESQDRGLSLSEPLSISSRDLSGDRPECWFVVLRLSIVGLDDLKGQTRSESPEGACRDRLRNRLRT
jgi:hypothetical protein